MPVFQTIDPVTSTTLQSYEHRQLLHRARRYIYIKGATNAVIALLFLLTFPSALKPRMVAITLADALFLVPYWFLVQRHPTLATCLSLCITSLAISAGDWIGGYQTGASGILYALLIVGGHLVLIKPLSTYLILGLIAAIYVGTIALEVNGVIPINFPFTLSNLWRVVSLNVVSMSSLTILIGVVTRLYHELLQRNKGLLALNAVSAAISQSLNLDEIVQLALDRVLEMMELDGGGLYLLESSTGEMVLKVHRNLAEEFIGRVSRIKIGTEGFTDSPFRTGQVLVAGDLSQHPVLSEMVGDGNWYRPLAIVPLKAEDKVLGTLNLLGRRGGSFTSQDVELLNTIGTQIGVAIERAWLYEREQKRAVQLVVVSKAARRSASILELDQLLQEVVTAIQQSFNYYHVGLFLLAEVAGELEMQAIAGGFADVAPPDHRLALGEGMVGWAAETGQMLLANDVSQEPHYVLGILKEALTRAELCVPLKLADQVIGVLDVQDTQLNAFDETDLLAMEILADQMAMAIENARLYQQTDKKLQTRVRELSALYAIAEMVNHSLDLSEILQLALDKAVEVAGMDAGGILLLDSSTNEFSLRAHRGGPPELIRAVSQIKTAEGLMPRMLNSVLTTDNLSEVTKDHRMALEKEGLQSLVSIPLKAKKSPVGVMVIASHSPRTFASQELELLATIGNQVGVAVDRANLQAQELRAAILEERQDMARQMHDDIAQTLGYLGLQVDSVMGSSSLAQSAQVQAELEGVRRAIEDAYERVRSSITWLREDIPDHFDLRDALSKIISEFEKQTGCSVASKIDASQLLRLPPSVAFQATYIIREALTNVRKHSGADSVHLTLQGLEDDMIEVTIQDNGRGFDLDSDQQWSWRGFGLRFMIERAERVGGSLRLESQPDQGTRVVVSLPSG